MSAILQLAFDELLERVKEKEEKEAKKRKRLADEFFDLLCSIKVYNLSELAIFILHSGIKV